MIQVKRNDSVRFEMVDTKNNREFICVQRTDGPVVVGIEISIEGQKMRLSPSEAAYLAGTIIGQVGVNFVDGSLRRTAQSLVDAVNVPGDGSSYSHDVQAAILDLKYALE